MQGQRWEVRFEQGTEEMGERLQYIRKISNSIGLLVTKKQLVYNKPNGHCRPIQGFTHQLHSLQTYIKLFLVLLDVGSITEKVDYRTF